MEKINQTKKIKKIEKNLIVGNLEITRAGMGFLICDDKEITDILIKPTDFNTAMHGDKVQVSLMNNKGKRQQGKVDKVLKRKRIEFSGKLQLSENFGFVIIDSERPMPDIFISNKNVNGAKNEDRVLVKILSWNENTKKPNGEITHIFKNDTEVSVNLREILLGAGFALQFSEQALEEAKLIAKNIPSTDLKNRKDFRNTLTFTIDPFDAKDFDDALSIKKINDSLWEVGVHIADVSYFLKEGTALDEEAYLKANTVYLPGKVNPMLPEELSNELCSLRPNEDSLTFAAVFNINNKGEIKKIWLGKTIIHSNQRFTYEDVQQIIESKTGLYSEEILFLNHIAQQIRKNRMQNGAINFSSKEVKFILNDIGEPINITVKESKEAHQLIEEFMLMANRTVAEEISKIKVKDKPLPFPYRVHDLPDKEKLIPFVAYAKKFGHNFDTSTPQKIAASFNQLLDNVKNTPQQHVLEQLGIRTMAKAKYDIENLGHYGLGFKHYCHFTSPIRRYPDVLVHRQLINVLNHKIEIDKKMQEKCLHCSERERAAMEAERAANKFMQVYFMKQFVGDEFDGIISGVAHFGFWVETIEHKCEGLVSINSLLEFDDFRLQEESYALVGKRSGREFKMGDKIKIKIVSANITRRQLDYEWVMQTNSKASNFTKPNKHPQKK